MNNYLGYYIYVILFLSFVPASHSNAQVTFTGAELLGRPTDTSIALNAVADTGIEAYVEYGITSGAYTHKTEAISKIASEPLEFIMNNLKSNTRYYYRLRYRDSGSRGEFSAKNEFTFHTTIANRHICFYDHIRFTSWLQVQCLQRISFQV